MASALAEAIFCVGFVEWFSGRAANSAIPSWLPPPRTQRRAKAKSPGARRPIIFFDGNFTKTLAQKASLLYNIETEKNCCRSRRDNRRGRREKAKYLGVFMVGFWNYTVILTYISLLISSLGIFLAGSGDPIGAIFCLLASGVCDMFDGKIARTRKKSTAQEKAFGIQLDSLSDIVCFGVLPAVIGVSLVPAEDTALRIVSWCLGGALILSSLIRLAYFNVTEEERQKTTKSRRTSFIGFPVTTSALAFPLALSIHLFLARLAEKFAEQAGWMVYPAAYVYPLMLAVCAFFYIAPVNVRKPSGLYLVSLCGIGLAEIAFIVYVLFFMK